MLPRAPVISPARYAVMVATSTSALAARATAWSRPSGALRNRAQGPDDLISQPHRDGMHLGKSHLECGGAEPRPVVVSWCAAVPSAAACLRAGRLRAVTDTEQGGRLPSHLARRDCCGLGLAGRHLPDATPADRVTVVAIVGLWPVTAGGAP